MVRWKSLSFHDFTADVGELSADQLASCTTTRLARLT